MIPFAAALVVLVELHGPEGRRFFINPAEITSVREPSSRDRQHFAPGTHCNIVTTDGKFISTRETCDEVRAAVSRTP